MKLGHVQCIFLCDHQGHQEVKASGIGNWRLMNGMQSSALFCINPQHPSFPAHWPPLQDEN